MQTVTTPDTYVIGRYYQVPCIYAAVWKMRLPIIGPLHEDKEHIGFEDLHWHIDWRFVSKRALNRLTIYGSIPVQAKVISQRNTTGPVTEKRLMCKRPMPEFPLRPYGNRVVSWMEKLETAYEGARLKCGMVCPHRGMPLAGCPVTDGVVICPAHGLAWEVEGGAMVKRVPPEMKAE